VTAEVADRCGAVSCTPQAVRAPGLGLLHDPYVQPKKLERFTQGISPEPFLAGVNIWHKVY